MPGSQKAKKATSSICPHNVVRIPIISVYVHLRIYVLFHIVVCARSRTACFQSRFFNEYSNANFAWRGGQTGPHLLCFHSGFCRPLSVAQLSKAWLTKDIALEDTAST